MRKKNSPFFVSKPVFSIQEKLIGKNTHIQPDFKRVCLFMSDTQSVEISLSIQNTKRKMSGLLDLESGFHRSQQGCKATDMNNLHIKLNNDRG